MILNDEIVGMMITTRTCIIALEKKIKPGGKWEKPIVFLAIGSGLVTGAMLLMR